MVKAGWIGNYVNLDKLVKPQSYDVQLHLSDHPGEAS